LTILVFYPARGAVALLQFIFVAQSFVYVDVTAFRIDLSNFFLS